MTCATHTQLLWGRSTGDVLDRTATLPGPRRPRPRGVFTALWGPHAVITVPARTEGPARTMPAAPRPLRPAACHPPPPPISPRAPVGDPHTRRDLPQPPSHVPHKGFIWTWGLLQPSLLPGVSSLLLGVLHTPAPHRVPATPWRSPRPAQALASNPQRRQDDPCRTCTAAPLFLEVGSAGG